MNFLFVNHRANAPKYGNPYRTYYLAKALLALGHTVTIVAASYSHIRQIQPVCTTSMSIENIDGVQFIFLKAPTYSKGFALRLKKIVGFLFTYRRFRQRILDTAKPDA